MASKAANFRSTCGCERRAPVCSSQRFPAVTPQVGQVTEDICLAVSALFFIVTECDYIQSRVCSILDRTKSEKRPGTQVSGFRTYRGLEPNRDKFDPARCVAADSKNGTYTDASAGFECGCRTASEVSALWAGKGRRRGPCHAGNIRPRLQAAARNRNVGWRWCSVGGQSWFTAGVH